MKLVLTDKQKRLVHLALEKLNQGLKKDLADPATAPKVVSAMEEDMFQLDLLITFFDKDRERNS